VNCLTFDFDFFLCYYEFQNVQRTLKGNVYLIFATLNRIFNATMQQCF